RVRSRARTPASAALATAAEAARDTPSDARSMSGYCARNAYVVERTANVSTAHHRWPRVKKSLGMMKPAGTGGGLDPRQHQFRPQSTGRRAAERKAAAIER